MHFWFKGTNESSDVPDNSQVLHVPIGKMLFGDIWLDWLIIIEKIDHVYCRCRLQTLGEWFGRVVQWYMWRDIDRVSVDYQSSAGQVSVDTVLVSSKQGWYLIDT